MKYQIQNIVATMDTGESINLERLAKSYDHCRYVPEKFPGLVLRIKDSKSSALIFSSGKVVVTGPKSIGELEKVVEIVESNIKNLK